MSLAKREKENVDSEKSADESISNVMVSPSVGVALSTVNVNVTPSSLLSTIASELGSVNLVLVTSPLVTSMVKSQVKFSSGSGKESSSIGIVSLVTLWVVPSREITLVGEVKSLAFVAGDAPGVYVMVISMLASSAAEEPKSKVAATPSTATVDTVKVMSVVSISSR